MVEASKDFVVPFAFKKVFSPEECTALVRAFKAYDVDKSGNISASEFKKACKDLGHSDVSDAQLLELFKKVDKNNDSTIDWEEFLDMMQTVQNKGKAEFGKVLQTAAGAGAKVEGAVGTHTYLLEERSVFSRTINKLFKDDADLSDRLPIDPDSDDLFHVMSDGLVLIKLLNQVEEGRVDMRTVNRGSSLNIYKIRENLQQALTACSGMIKLVGIGADSFLDKTPHLILAVLWQVCRLIQTKAVSLKDVPEIMRLAKDGEELADLNKLPAEQILIRWMNFHLRNAGQKEIANLGKDLVDSKALLYVLNQLDKDKCTLEAIDEADDLKRAENMILQSQKIEVADVASARDIIKGNAKVNTIFVAEIFNTRHGLQELTKEEYEAAAMLDDDIEGSKEERAFRFWINSLGIEDVFITNLYEEARDGLVLLKVIDKIKPGTVDWKKVAMKPKNMFEAAQNCDQCIESCNKLKIKLVGLGAKDIAEGHKKNILAIVWQLVRLHYLQLLGSKTEKDLIAWVNEICPDAPIETFKSANLANGRNLIKLCGNIEPRVINWDLVTPGETPEDKELNAKYAISIARKLGAVIFLVWEDIPALNPKMLLIFVASLWDLKQQAK